MWQLHCTTTRSSAPIRRSISGLLLLRQVPPLRKEMNSRNDWVTRSSKAPASPPTRGGNSVIPYDSIITVGSIQIYYKISASVTGIRLRQLVPKCASNPTYKEQCYSLSADVHFNKRKYHIDLISKLVNMEDTATSSSSENASKFPHESSTVSDCQSEMDMYSSLPTEFGKKRRHDRAEQPHYVPRNTRYAAATENSDCSEGWNYDDGRAEKPHYVPRNMKYAAATENSDCSKGRNYNGGRAEKPHYARRNMKYAAATENSDCSKGRNYNGGRAEKPHYARRNMKYAAATENSDCSKGSNYNDVPAEQPHYAPRNTKYTATTRNSVCSKGWNCNEPFDICLSGSGSSALKASLHARKMENQTEAEDMVQFTNPEHVAEFTNPEHVAEFTNPIVLLGSGMVLLKHFVTLSEQVEIVKTCRELGLGPGGFYQPGFKDGAKLRLQMMCLGLNWDPETRKYDYKRAIDDTKPPGIPQEFSLLVERAIQEARAHIKEELRVCSVEEILPAMSPDICIANFYKKNGRLGLHQDRDESRKSLQEGLPVVSVSVGDSADFLYGVRRDIAKAESVILESGDVLIFGGHSRHIFHGVTSIIPDSAPITLLEETGLRPGRLNLTFRKF